MINIEKLNKTYNGFKALENLDFEISSQSIFGLIGPNGAGKSTTINIICGITKKSSGNIKIFNLDLEKHSIKIKNKMGIVLEKLALFEGLTGIEHLTFVAEVYGLKRYEYEKRIDELLSYFDLSFAKERLIATYSKGMIKKLAFISAIIHKPKLLILDEPFDNVDPVSRKKMKDILIRMQNNGVTVFITTHSLAEIEFFCDEVAIINKGKIIFRSDTKDIHNKIKNEVTKETYSSLEEIFIDLTVEENDKTKELTWL